MNTMLVKLIRKCTQNGFADWVLVLLVFPMVLAFLFVLGAGKMCLILLGISEAFTHASAARLIHCSIDKYLLGPCYKQPTELSAGEGGKEVKGTVIAHQKWPPVEN